MEWSKLYPADVQPTPENVSASVDSPLWDELLGHIQKTYSSEPNVSYSTCPMAPGWNVKFKKGGRALCTLYPREGGFVCMISIGARERDETELLLPTFDEYTQALYAGTKPFNGGRWLSLDVTSRRICDDVKTLLAIRANSSAKKVKKP